MQNLMLNFNSREPSGGTDAAHAWPLPPAFRSRLFDWPTRCGPSPPPKPRPFPRASCKRRRRRCCCCRFAFVCTRRVLHQVEIELTQESLRNAGRSPRVGGPGAHRTAEHGHADAPPGPGHVPPAGRRGRPPEPGGGPGERLPPGGHGGRLRQRGGHRARAGRAPPPARPGRRRGLRHQQAEPPGPRGAAGRGSLPAQPAGAGPRLPRPVPHPLAGHPGPPAGRRGQPRPPAAELEGPGEAARGGQAEGHRGLQLHPPAPGGVAGLLPRGPRRPPGGIPPGTGSGRAAGLLPPEGRPPAGLLLPGHGATCGPPGGPEGGGAPGPHPRPGPATLGPPAGRECHPQVWLPSPGGRERAAVGLGAEPGRDGGAERNALWEALLLGSQQRGLIKRTLWICTTLG